MRIRKKEDLEFLIDKYTSKGYKRQQFNKQLSFIMLFLVIFSLTAFFATNFIDNELPVLQGYVAYQVDNTVGGTVDGVAEFRNEVRESDDLAVIKLFFYTVWIIVVLVASAIYYEFKRD